MALDPVKIEERLDKTLITSQPVNMALGGVRFTDMGQVMEFAKLVSLSGVAVPPHLRNNPGACLAICTSALRWNMDPFAVASQSYAVENFGVTTISYMSQLVHAVILAHAPLRGRLRHEILGEGDERRCKVSGTFIGERDPHVYISETLAKLREARGRNQAGKVKGSPLWDTQPEVQLYYHATRAWSRMFAPDALLGVYSKEELEDHGFEAAKDVTPAAGPSLAERLKNGTGTNRSRGFSTTHVDEHLGEGRRPAPGAGSEPVENEGTKPETEAEPEPADRDATERAAEAAGEGSAGELPLGQPAQETRQQGQDEDGGTKGRKRKD